MAVRIGASTNYSAYETSLSNDGEEYNYRPVFVWLHSVVFNVIVRLS